MAILPEESSQPHVFNGAHLQTFTSENTSVRSENSARHPNDRAGTKFDQPVGTKPWELLLYGAQLVLQAVLNHFGRHVMWRITSSTYRSDENTVHTRVSKSGCRDRRQPVDRNWTGTVATGLSVAVTPVSRKRRSTVSRGLEF